MGGFNILFLFDGSTPAPPYITASVSSIGLTYIEDSGPAESGTFRISAAGLRPVTGNITVTQSNPTNFELWDGSTWQSGPFTIPYTGGAISTTSIYKVRLKAGMAYGTYTETITLTGGGATAYVINVTGIVTRLPSFVYLSDYYYNY